MRPHRLLIEGFGPFADAQTIDFDAVGADGIFLIAGPTGAGKTTILDALCFALYNAVPGARGAAKELRSKHAAPTAPTRVELEFSVGARRFRIERTPPYERPRKRGAGTTVQAHRVTLSELVAGRWDGIGRTAQEVQSFLQHVIGLTAEQFTKLIVLPQGEFSAFLHADPGEREAILTRLFSTEHFAGVERRLAERATEARRRTQAAEEKRRFVMERVSESSWDDLPVPGGDRADSADLLAHLGTARTLAWEARAAAEHTAALAESAAETSARAAADWSRREADRRELRSFETELTRWEAAEDERSAGAERLTRARAAAPLVRLHRQAVRAEQSAQTERARADSARADLLSALPAAHSLDSSEDVTAELLASARGHLTAAAARLRRTAQLEATASEAQESCEQAEIRVTSLSTAEEKIEDEQTATRGLAEETTGRYDALEQDAVRLEALRADRRTLDALAAAVAEHAAAESDFDSVSRTAETTAAALARLRREVRRSLAGRLAADLSPGTPCPVCGSERHPLPASLGDTAPTAEDEEAVELAERDARDALAAARTRLAAAHTDLTRRREEAAGLEAETLRTALAAAESASAERSRLAETRDAARLRVAELETQMSEHRRRRTRAEADLAAARTALVRARARAEEAAGAETEAPTALTAMGLASPEDVAEAERGLSVLETVDLRRDECVRAADAARAACAEHRLRLGDFTRALEDSPFDDEDGFAVAAALPLADLEAEEEERRAWGARLEDRRTSEQLRRAREDAVSDEELTARAAAARDAEQVRLTRREEARSRLAVAADRAVLADRALADGRAELSDSEARLREWRRDVDVAELVQGTSRDARQPMSLSSFALVAIFAEVATLASERLLAMTGGRFRLMHSMQQGTRERRAGLGLRIVDTYTDETRDPRTLSGGESFMAALSLALGLADTVRQTSGGADLGTLFLDEGFGTLDPDALADVLTVLDGLRTGGRTIGIISHVSELRQTLPTRLLVWPGRAGSSISTGDGDDTGT